MNSDKVFSLEHLRADPRMVEELYAHDKISPEARAYALDYLSSANQWGLWCSRVLLAIGSTLVLSGLIYFFAFNWSKIPPLIKLSSIQLGIVGCLIFTYFYTLKRLIGQNFLFCASFLVGVFMAVFGQIYQTGADAYKLFMMWSLMIFGWILISNFSPLWILWLAVTNLFIILWWDQGALPDHSMKYMVFIYLVILNSALLSLREYFAGDKDKFWMQQPWVRGVLVLAVLIPMAFPIIILIMNPSSNFSIIASAGLGLLGHTVMYSLYRYQRPNIKALAATILSLCIIAEVLALKVIAELPGMSDILMFLVMAVATLTIFSVTAIYLRKLMDILEVDHA